MDDCRILSAITIANAYGSSENGGVHLDHDELRPCRRSDKHRGEHLPNSFDVRTAIRSSLMASLR